MDRIRLKDGRIAVVDFLGKDADPKEHLGFLNTLVKERSYIHFDRKATLKEEIEWIKTNAEGLRKKERFVLVARVDGKLAGNSGSFRGRLKERDNASLGIALAKEYRGLGLGEGLLRLNIRYTKKLLRPKNIYLSVFATNKRAQKLYRKLGFREIARLPKWINHYGKYVDLILMRL